MTMGGWWLTLYTHTYPVSIDEVVDLGGKVTRVNGSDQEGILYELYTPYTLESIVGCLLPLTSSVVVVLVKLCPRKIPRFMIRDAK